MRVPMASICICMLANTSALAQTPRSAPPVGQVLPTVRLFLDCQDVRCDTQYIRTEVAFVDHVRERKDADVHLLITAQGAGSGGRQYTLSFIGQQSFDGINDTLTFDTQQSDTEEVTRRELVRVIKLGLTRYVTHSRLGANLQLTFRPSDQPQKETAARQAHDPWNYWVFRTRFSGRSNGEQRTKSKSFEGNITVNRTTDAWKVNVSNNARYNDSKYKFSDGSTYTGVTRSWGSDGILVKSLTGHWSAGLRAGVSSSTYNNLDLAVWAAPAVEWNFFPYTEATTHQLTVEYDLGFQAVDYRIETVYGKLSERLLSHAVAVSLDVKRTWGSVRADFDFSQYLSDVSKYRISVGGETDLRLFKGLSLSIDASGSKVRDQLYLPKGDATDEEVLARQRQLATGYRYSFSVGISFTFGSIYNNIVNTRM